MKLTVTIDLMRHGQKQGDANTLFGFRQVAASVRTYIDTPMDGAYCSDQHRSMETVRHALLTLDQHNIPVEPHPAFFIGHLLGDEFLAEFAMLEPHLADSGTAKDWIEQWSQGFSVRERVTQGLIHIAGELTMRNPGKLRLFGLVGYHAPGCEMAAVKPWEIGKIGFADIVRYTLTNDGSGWTITSSEHLKCPLVAMPT